MIVSKAHLFWNESNFLLAYFFKGIRNQNSPLTRYVYFFTYNQDLNNKCINIKRGGGGGIG